MYVVTKNEMEWNNPTDKLEQYSNSNPTILVSFFGHI